MPKILLDFTATKSIHNGLGQFSIALGNAIIKLKPASMHVDVLIPQGKESLFPNADGYRYKSIWIKNTVPRWMTKPIQKKWHYDIWHLTNQNSDFTPLSCNTPMLLTIHDLNFLRERQESQWQRKLDKLNIKIAQASRITTISDFVRREINEHTGINQNQIDLIYNGGIQEINLESHAIPNLTNTHFLFSIGEFLAKKNFISLLGMLKNTPDYHLVIAGKNTTDYAQKFRQEVSHLNLENRVHLLGHISDEQRHWLYSNMQGFVFPSITEGFGLPIIEAMYYQKPVFCSNLTSLPEIGGPYPFYWESFNPEHMAQVVDKGMKKTQTDPTLLINAHEHAKQFNWNRAAHEYLNVYSEMLKASQ